MEESAVQKLLEKAARRAERTAVMDTCPPQDDEPNVGRTQQVSQDGKSRKVRRMMPLEADSDASTVPASETEIQQKLALSKKQVEPETDNSNKTDSQRPKLPQRIQSKELLKDEATSPNQSQGNPGVRTQATAVKAKAQPKVAFKEETETTAHAVAQCLARKSTAELNGGSSGGPSPAGSADQEQDASDSESEVNSDVESEEYERKEALVKAKKAAHARYMRFSRSLTSKRTPIEVRRAGAAAKNDSPKLQMLQEQWASCKGIWSQSDFVIRLRQKTRQRQYGARRWMTRQELICKYSSCAIADKIIAAKQGDKEAKKTQIRSHPDLHGDDSDDTRQYLVWDKEGSENTTDHVCSELFTAAEKGDDPLETRRGRSRKRKDKKGRKSNKKKRKGSTSSTRSSSSSSSSQEKVDSSSSSSEAAKKKKKGKSKTGKTKSKNGKASKTAAKAKGKKDKKDKDKDKDKKKPKEVISSDSSDESEEPEETEEKKQKRLAKEAEAQKKKEAKDAEQAKKKAEREKNQELKKEQKKGTQALSKLGANILKAAGLDEKLESMSKSVKDAILMEVKPHLDKLRSTRRSLQNAVDSAQVGHLGSMHSLIAKADSVNADFVTMARFLFFGDMRDAVFKEKRHK
ncbi:unnamed protein product, partial [Cladocopium goreaui]